MRLFSVKSLQCWVFAGTALVSPHVLAWDWNSWLSAGYTADWQPTMYGSGDFEPDSNPGSPMPTDIGYMVTAGQPTPGYLILDQVFSTPEKINFTWSYENSNTLLLEDVWFGYMLNHKLTPLYHTLADPAVIAGSATAYVGANQDFAFYMFMPNGEQPNIFGVSGPDEMFLTATITPVPEPGTDVLMLVGLGVMAGWARRYRSRRTAHALAA